MPGADLDRLITTRVEALFKNRGISQREFAEAIGVSPSWVSAFFGHRRPANDIHTLSRIARYFGVSVGYLLNETERGRDAGATTLLGAWEGLSDDLDRDAVLQLALRLRGRGGGAPPPGGNDDPGDPGGRRGPGRGAPPKRKR